MTKKRARLNFIFALFLPDEEYFPPPSYGNMMTQFESGYTNHLSMGTRHDLSILVKKLNGSPSGLLTLREYIYFSSII